MIHFTHHIYTFTSNCVMKLVSTSYCLISLVTKWDCDLFHSFPLHFNIKLFGAQMVLQLIPLTTSQCQCHQITALVSIKTYMPLPLPYFKVNIYPFPLPHFVSIFVAYLWSFRWPNYIVTLPRYFSFRLPHLNIHTWPPSDKLDKNSQRTWLSENFNHWNGYSQGRGGGIHFLNEKSACAPNICLFVQQ